jgi:hypothetical protein
MRKILSVIAFFIFASLAVAQQMISDLAVVSKNNAKNRLDIPSPSYMDVLVFSEQELIAIQWKNLNTDNLEILLFNDKDVEMDRTILLKGTTIAYFETQKRYGGQYEIRIRDGDKWLCTKVKLVK